MPISKMGQQSVWKMSKICFWNSLACCNHYRNEIFTQIYTHYCNLGWMLYWFLTLEFQKGVSFLVSFPTLAVEIVFLAKIHLQLTIHLKFCEIIIQIGNHDLSIFDPAQIWRQSSQLLQHVAYMTQIPVLIDRLLAILMHSFLCGHCPWMDVSDGSILASFMELIGLTCLCLSYMTTPAGFGNSNFGNDWSHLDCSPRGTCVEG